MYIGHIYLATPTNGAGERFASLVHALQKNGVRQYVLVRNIDLARRLDLICEVDVGPVVRSAVSAACLMPAVDVAHMHDPQAARAGLLLALTRSIPFVLTRHHKASSNGPVARAIYRRAAGVVYRSDADAAKHLRIYRHALSKWHDAAASL